MKTIHVEILEGIHLRSRKIRIKGTQTIGEIAEMLGHTGIARTFNVYLDGKLATAKTKVTMENICIALQKKLTKPRSARPASRAFPYTPENLAILLNHNWCMIQLAVREIPEAEA